MKRLVMLVITLSLLLNAIVGYAAPSISSWNPVNGTTGVNENQAITATFNSNPMLKASTVTGANIYIRPGNSCTSGTSHPVTIDVSGIASPTSTVILTPTTPFTSGASYIVCARTGIQNTSNQALTANSQATFTVRDYLMPTVSTYLPNPPTGVQSNPNPSIVVTFSELMNTATITTTSVVLNNLTDGVSVTMNNPAFTVSSGKQVATFTLPSALASLKTYQVTVKNTVTDLAGNAMVSDFSWTFSIDSTAPTVLSYTPFSIAFLPTVYVNTTTPLVSAVFSEQITTPTTSNFYLKQGATTIGTTPSFNSTTNTASLALSAALTNNLTYTATLVGSPSASSITDVLLNKLAASLSWSFIVDSIAPTVSAVSPANGATGIDPETKILVDFTENQAMNESTFNDANITISDGTDNITVVSTYNATTKRLTITPANGLNYSTTYTVSIGGAIADKAGNLLVAYPSWSFTTRAVTSNAYSQVPPFISAPVTPNVLIILDNSNSMDEDMNVNAIGSAHCTNSSDPNSCSKSIIARKALTNIINTYSDKMRIGLMSYKLAGATAYNLHNNFYFASYDPRTYCPNPPAACKSYCINEVAADKDACNAGCQAQNALFDAIVRDEILIDAITPPSTVAGTSIGSTRRQTFCPLIYPKTQQYTDVNGTTVYYGLPGTLYSGTNYGIQYAYSEAYKPSTTTDSYKVYNNKTGTSNGNVGYSNLAWSSSFTPTDSDLAVGFEDFGRRNYWYYTGTSWFQNTSPGPGYLQVAATINDPLNNTQKNALLTKLGGNRTPAAYENDDTGYMTCESGSVNTCAHIINAGLTPTAGTLQTAIDYYKGTLNQGSAIATPIQYSCQHNYVIYVTDGLPSVNETGTAGTASALLPAVLTKLDNLRCPSSDATASNCNVTKTFGAATANYDVKTFVIGMGLNNDARASLDSMAVKGGTDVSGSAYYANNLTELNNSLVNVFQNILTGLAGGTAASIVNNSGEAGTNLLEAVFYPEKTFETKKVSWIGEMQNMWFYLDPYLNANAIREDTVADKILDMQQDYKVTIDFDLALGETRVNRFNNKGVFLSPSIKLDDLSPIWRAGELLYRRDLSTNPRTLKTTINGTSLIDFSGANKAVLKPYLQVATDPEALGVIEWVHGKDDLADTSKRSRTVSYKGLPVSPWRLGDIISSTPKVQPGSPIQGYDLDFNDFTYKTFWSSNNYKSRGMVYVGANDGMLHAFKLGTITKVSNPAYPTRVAEITPNTDPPLGQEEWAFIPQNALPYLKYLMQPDYSHLYTVDATTRLIDVSINAPTGCSGDYWDCTRDTVLDSTNADSAHKADLLYAQTSWRTVLIGGMGLGGASRPSDGACAIASDCVKAPIATPTGLENVGLSSYFALDVSEPETPSLMWEFTNSALGYTTTPPAIVRINGKKGGVGLDKDNPDKSKNGRWFAVYGSGPTGPINTTTHQFLGKSDQTLKLFIVDLKTGVLLRTIDTGVAKAFAGSLSSNSTLDTDFWDATAPGYYSHDVVYIGYSNFDTPNNRWDGGVYRLVTNESTDPADWTYSKVISGVGPVTTAVAPLQNRTDKQLWLYFGGGRYFYKDISGIDDADADPANVNARRYIYGIKEPCYPKDPGMTAKNAFDPACSSAVTVGSLTDQSDNASSVLSSSDTGWKIKLSASNSSYKSERLLTNPSASYNGNVTFTTFMPTSDICGYGGQTFVWVVRGMSGSAPLASSLKGKLILQLSTGAFKTVDLASALTARQGRRTGTGDTSNNDPGGGYTGSTSKDAPPEQKPPKGVPRILQIRER